MVTNQALQKALILIFDPGETTGVALMRSGCVLRTEALDYDETLRYARRMAVRHSTFHNQSHLVVVIEKGPWLRHDSPLTRRLESELTNLFPNAHLVPPSAWKDHPAAQCRERLSTRHERDAVCLGRVFLAKGVPNGESQDQEPRGRKAHAARPN